MRTIVLVTLAVGLAGCCCIPTLSDEEIASLEARRVEAEKQRFRDARAAVESALPQYVNALSTPLPGGSPEQVRNTENVHRLGEEILTNLRTLWEADDWKDQEAELIKRVAFLFGAALSEERGKPPEELSESAIEKIDGEGGLIPWMENLQLAVGDDLRTHRAAARLVKVSCREASKQMGSGSRDLTDVQRDRMFESDYKGRAFQWPLEIVDVSETLGMMSIVAKCSPRSDSYLHDVSLRVRLAHKEIAAQLRKGAVYTIEGEFTGAGDFLGLSADFVGLVE